MRSTTASLLSLPYCAALNTTSLLPRYQQDGAVVLQNTLEQAIFQPILMALHQRLALLETHWGHPETNIEPNLSTEALGKRLITLEGAHPGSQSALYEAMALCPEVLALTAHPAIQNLVKTLLQSDTVALHPRTLLLMHMPQNQWHLGTWHQDWHYNRGPSTTLTLYIPLQPVSEENGSLLMALKEHQNGPLPHAASQSTIQTKWQTLPETVVAAFKPEHIVSTQLSTGDILCFNSLTPHSARLNQSDQVRFVLNLRYYDLSDPEYLLQGWQLETTEAIKQAMRRPQKDIQTKEDT